MKTAEVVEVEGDTLHRTWECDPLRNLERSVDRNGRVALFAYDDLNRRKSATYYISESAESGGTSLNVEQYGYDIASRRILAPLPTAPTKAPAPPRG